MRISGSTVAGLVLGIAGIGVSVGIFFYQEGAARASQCQMLSTQALSDATLVADASSRTRSASDDFQEAEQSLRAAQMRREKAEIYFDALSIEGLAGRYASILRRAKVEYVQQYGEGAFERPEFGIITAGTAWSEVITRLGYPSSLQDRQLDARRLQGQGFGWANYIPLPSASEREVDAVIAALDELSQEQAVRRDNAFDFEFQNAADGATVIARLTSETNDANTARTAANSALSLAQDGQDTATAAVQKSCRAVADQCSPETVPPTCAT